MAMIDINGKLLNTAHLVSAEVVTDHYMNGSSSKLVIKMDDGSQIVYAHGFGFDAFAALEKLKA